MILATNVNLIELANQTDNFTGADLQNLCREAVFACLRNNFANRIVDKTNFEYALKICKSSVSTQTIEKYDKLSQEIRKKKINEYIQSSFEFR